MIASSKTMDELKAIGLNKYERNLWAALLSRSSSTAGELADISKVPRSRCYDVLDSLATKGFIVVQPGKPMKYVAISPKEALARAKKKIEEEAVEMGNKIISLIKSDSVRELEKLHKENIKTVNPEDMTGALRGRYAMLQQLESMLKKARKTVKMITTENALSEIVETQLPLIKKVAESGVKIQIATPITKQSSNITKDLSKYAQIRNIGNVEHIEKVLARMYIVDGEEFLFGLTDDSKTHPTQDVAFWTQSTHAASNVFEPMFDLVWHHSKPIK